MKKTLSYYVFGLLFIALLFFTMSCSNPSNTDSSSNGNSSTQPSDGNNTNNQTQQLYNEVMTLINNKTFKESDDAGYYEGDTIDWVNQNNTFVVNNSTISVNIDSYSKTFDFTPLIIQEITHQSYAPYDYDITLTNGVSIRVSPKYYTGLSYRDFGSTYLSGYKWFTIAQNNSGNNSGGTSVTASDINGTWYLNKNSNQQQNCIFNNGNITVIANIGSGNTRNATYTINSNRITINLSMYSQNFSAEYSVQLQNNQLTLSGVSGDYNEINSGLFQSTNLTFVK